MKHPLLILIFSTAVFGAIPCGCSPSPVAPNKVEGYPVYKFLDFGDYKHRKELRVIDSKGKENTVYIRNSDYRKLWAINPHELNRMGKSHFVRIGYREREEDGRHYKWATSFDSEWVERKPDIRK